MMNNLKVYMCVCVCIFTGLVSVFLINFYTGLMTFTHYVDCDPFKSGKIGAMDQLLPFYVMDVFGHINTITGVFVAGIFAASLG
jgi:solute carrier family 5 (sodium-coupled monocarboxylate transporter), member 8/12